jgi:hypothetical protein
VLLIWVLVRQDEAMQKLLLIYWRVASLLAITLYLFIGALPVGFISGWLARILIPISLWYWVDLNEEIRDQPPSALKLTLTSWRWAVSIYCAIGVLAQIPVLRCAALTPEQVVATPACNVWLAPPWAFRELFHSGARPFFLGFLGITGLVIYTLFLGYFVFFRLGKRKRSAMGN